MYFRTWQAYLVFLFIEHKPTTHIYMCISFFDWHRHQVGLAKFQHSSIKRFSNLIVYTNLTPWYFFFLIFIFFISYLHASSCFIHYFILNFIFYTLFISFFFFIQSFAPSAHSSIQFSSCMWLLSMYKFYW